MSAFICDNLHISALAFYAYHHKVHGQVSALANCTVRELAQRLYEANARSVAHRYNEPQQDSFVYDPKGETMALTASSAAILKSARCFAYQACEIDTWEGGPIHALLPAIEYEATLHIPGYEEANWGAPIPTPTRKRALRPV